MDEEEKLTPLDNVTTIAILIMNDYLTILDNYAEVSDRINIEDAKSEFCDSVMRVIRNYGPEGVQSL